MIAPFGVVEYFVQAVDASGNVALATESGAPFGVDGGAAPATIFALLLCDTPVGGKGGGK
ncbi:MAG: hypothetical protein IPL28_00950 [Chloroflexi bacterium]|nr:hypothetical protein [Chloroflexota bacterium]